MNATIYRLSVIIFLLTCNLAAGQKKRCPANDNNEKVIRSWDEIESGKTRNAYYLNNEWTPFDLFLKSGRLVEGGAMRLNLLTNQFEVKYGSKIKGLSADKVEYFEFNDNGIIRLFESIQSYEIGEDQGQGFYEVIVSGDPGLLYHVYLTPAEELKKLTLKKSKTIKAKKRERYLLVRNGQLIAIPSVKDSWYHKFIEQEKDIASYMRTHRLSFDEKDDLIKLLKYLKSEV